MIQCDFSMTCRAENTKYSCARYSVEHTGIKKQQQRRLRLQYEENPGIIHFLTIKRKTSNLQKIMQDFPYLIQPLPTVQSPSEQGK